MIKHVFSAIWLVATYFLLNLALLPIASFVLIYLDDLSISNALYLTVSLSAGITLGVFLLILASALLVRCLPRNVEGRHCMFSDRGAIIWALNTYFPGILLKLFQPILFLNDWCRVLILWALRADIHSTVVITSSTRLAELDLISVGRDSLIGEHCHIIPAFLPKHNLIQLARVSIGKRCFVGAGSKICAGSVLGDDVSVSNNVLIKPYVKIGSGTRIGQDTHIDIYATIGKNAVIGSDCKISRRSRISDNQKVPDGSIL